MKTDLVLPSFAKVNLNLHVIGRRPDGYHELFTVFQTVSLCDELAFFYSTEIIVECDDLSIPTGEQNLIYKAISLLREKYGKRDGVRIELKKRIPSPGGLGGGSSNAATALIGASKLWGLDMSTADLVELGSEIGADVPFFFFGGTAFGTGTGTDIEPAPDFESKYILIVCPRTYVSTEEAYRSLRAPDLTKKSAKRILKNYRKEAEALYKGHFELLNDFETVIFETYPSIKNTADILKKTGANAVSLSGSGPSVFGFFNDGVELEAAALQFREHESVECFPVRTISNKSYRSLLGLKPS